MAVSTKHTSSALSGIPNQLTVARLVLAVVLFVLMTLERYEASFYVFLVAAGTDWLDGFLARRYGWVTTLGRILDPFADKVIICGTFIFLVAVNDPHLYAWHLRAWVVVVIVGREILITALRSYLEQQGADFSASLSGKLKMVAQCLVASLSLYYLWRRAELGDSATFGNVVIASVWATVLLTVYSGVAYIVAAARLMRPA